MAFCQELFSRNFFAAPKYFSGPLTNRAGTNYNTRQLLRTDLHDRDELNSTSDVLLQTDFPDLELYASGKVRDIYKVDDDHLLFVATDRISAFDYVLATGIPQKGRVLTQLSLFWFEFLKDIVPNHLATADVHKYPPELQKYAGQLRGRSMLVVRADMVAIECVVRGYLSGSGWKEYKNNGSVCGIKLPAGLRESDKLPEPIFTPGHQGDQRP